MKSATSATKQNTTIKKEWEKPKKDELPVEETTQLYSPDVTL